ncbi:hypothetical protein [Catenuloplanes japonicus]|uniref:hypothetical protein n=1 Tax=Catenuloplanes japonicus TaxID=33876 RepID=UPI000525ED98|nr:hypothetical protein [Catenuloplanes japonicus]
MLTSERPVVIPGTTDGASVFTVRYPVLVPLPDASTALTRTLYVVHGFDPSSTYPVLPAGSETGAPATSSRSTSTT